MGLVVLSRSDDFLVVPGLDLVEFEAFDVELNFLSRIVSVVFVEFKDFEVELSFFTWNLSRVLGFVLVELVEGLRSLVWFFFS